MYFSSDVSFVLILARSIRILVEWLSLSVCTLGHNDLRAWIFDRLCLPVPRSWEPHWYDWLYWLLRQLPPFLRWSTLVVHWKSPQSGWSLNSHCYDAVTYKWSTSSFGRPRRCIWSPGLTRKSILASVIWVLRSWIFPLTLFAENALVAFFQSVFFWSSFWRSSLILLSSLRKG